MSLQHPSRTLRVRTTRTTALKAKAFSAGQTLKYIGPPRKRFGTIRMNPTRPLLHYIERTRERSRKNKREHPGSVQGWVTSTSSLGGGAYFEWYDILLPEDWEIVRATTSTRSQDMTFARSKHAYAAAQAERRPYE